LGLVCCQCTGGLLAGVSRVAKALNHKIKVYAVEPRGKNLQEALERLGVLDVMS
jgi:cysteine synthase